MPPPPVLAAQSLSNIVKTSLGPVGLDKMLVDDVGVSALGVVGRCMMGWFTLCPTCGGKVYDGLVHPLLGVWWEGA